MNIFKMCPKSWLQNQLCKHPVVFHSFLFFSFFLVNVSLKTSIIFMENKNITLTIMYPLQVRRETEFSPQTGKPNKKVSKTAVDNRQSFINKDVLPMKIITAAKQNITQDTELLSEFCQQTFSGKLCSAGDRLWFLFPFKAPLHLCWTTFQQYRLLICVPQGDGPGGPGLSSSLLIRDDMFEGLTWLPCCISLLFSYVCGRDKRQQAQKNRD